MVIKNADCIILGFDITYYKSFEEYCLKKKRGKADASKNLNEKYILQHYKILYSLNKNNPEKLKIIKKVFNDSFFNIK